MPNAPDINKKLIHVRLALETCRAVEKKYHQEGDTSESIAYVRALEDATRDVVLDSHDYELILERAKQNEAKRK